KCKRGAASRRHFQNRAVQFQLVSLISAKKKHLFGFDYHVYCAAIMPFKAISVSISDTRFSGCTHPKDMEKSGWHTACEY
ncbi:hypothetical protein DF186_17995, partial [Enterococcus hirae]